MKKNNNSTINRIIIIKILKIKNNSDLINRIPTTEKLNDVTISWKPYQPNSNVLEIGNNSDTEIKMVETIFNERMKFWERMQPLLIDNFLL